LPSGCRYTGDKLNRIDFGQEVWATIDSLLVVCAAQLLVMQRVFRVKLIEITEFWLLEAD
jgi:hypothetical protein